MPSTEVRFRHAAYRYCEMRGINPDQPVSVRFAGFRPEDPTHNPWPWIHKWEIVAKDLEEHYYRNLSLRETGLNP